MKQVGLVKLLYVSCYVYMLYSQFYFSMSRVLDLEWISKVRVNTHSVLMRAQHIQSQKIPNKQWQVKVSSPLYFICCIIRSGSQWQEIFPALTDNYRNMDLCFKPMYASYAWQ